jgi:hypothetical protein
MSSYSYRNLVVLLTALALSSCSEVGTDPGPLEVRGAVGAAAAAADAVLEDLYQMSDVVPLMGGPAMQAQQDLQVNRTRSRVKTFFDGNGLEQEVFDPISTASIHDRGEDRKGEIEGQLLGPHQT